MSKAKVLKAIRQKCRDCTCDSTKQIRLCAGVTCALWPYRLGTDPDKRELSPEAKRALADNLGQKSLKKNLPASR